MTLFEFEIIEKHTPSPLNGEIKAASKAEAYRELMDWYCMELGTVESEIKLTVLEATK